ncbi:MAG: hypothetical protein ACFFCW_23855 [Candidatus Hodarchaeota archaeon]
MEIQEYSARISVFRGQLFALLSADPLTVREILDMRPPRFDVEGVYVISTPDDGEIVYVGKTRTKSVIGRVSDHRDTDTKSDLKGMLRLFPDYPQEVNNYLVRCINISDARKRTFFEHFSIGVLSPPFNKE